MNAASTLKSVPKTIFMSKAGGPGGARKFEVTCSNCNVRELCLPGLLCAEDIERAENLVYARRRVKRGEALFHAGAEFNAVYAIRSGIEVAAEAASGDEALALVRGNDYDVVMLDMSMPGLSGIDLIKRLKIERPKLRILVLSMHGEVQYAARALKAGAAGYLNKDSAAELLVGALRKIAAGGVHIGEAAVASLISPDKPPHHALSDREFEVLRLLVAGQSPTGIAEQLHLSVKTVSTHKTRILEKLKLKSVADLVRYAMENRLL